MALFGSRPDSASVELHDTREPARQRPPGFAVPHQEQPDRDRPRVQRVAAANAGRVARRRRRHGDVGPGPGGDRVVQAASAAASSPAACACRHCDRLPRGCGTAPGLPARWRMRLGRRARAWAHWAALARRGVRPESAAIAGKKAARPGASAHPAPGLFSICTVPSRQALSRPGVPQDMSSETSSWSIAPPRCRRISTCTGCRPRNVFTQSAPSRTVRSPSSTSAQPSARASTTCSNQRGSVWPGVSNASPGLPASAGARRCRRSCQMSKNGRNGVTSGAAEQLRQHARHHAAVLQHIGQARPARRCGPPARTIFRPRRAPDRRRRDACGGPGHARRRRRCGRRGYRLWRDRRGRAAAGRRKQVLRAVDVGEHGFQQRGALGQSGRQGGELGFAQQERDRVAAPLPGIRARPAAPPRPPRRRRGQFGGAFLQHHGAHAEQRAEHAPPRPAQAAGFDRAVRRCLCRSSSAKKQSFFEKKDQKTFAPGALAKASLCGAVTRAPGAGERKSFLVLVFQKRTACLAWPHLRRSNVRGCSFPALGKGSGMGPAVWPNGKNRARRRASASLAFTGKVS